MISATEKDTLTFRLYLLLHKQPFNVWGIDRNEFGVGFYITIHIERQSTVVVEIGFDGHQHGFDEIDVFENSAILCLPVIPR